MMWGFFSVLAVCVTAIYALKTVYTARASAGVDISEENYKILSDRMTRLEIRLGLTRQG